MCEYVGVCEGVLGPENHNGGIISTTLGCLPEHGPRRQILEVELIVQAHIFKVMTVGRCFGVSLWRLRLSSCRPRSLPLFPLTSTSLPSLFLLSSPSFLYFSSLPPLFPLSSLSPTTPGSHQLAQQILNPYPTNKIISNILLMSQKYIKSLKVDEYTWQRTCFGGPRHLAPVWHTPKLKMLQDLSWKTGRGLVGMKLYSMTVYLMDNQSWHFPPALACLSLLHSCYWVVQD